MTLAELAREYGLLASLLIAAAVSAWGTVKLIVPRLVDSYLEREKAKADQAAADRVARRELETEIVMGERQEDVALLSQVVNLQAQLLRQNDTLIGYMTKKLDDDLQKLALELHHELQDIEQRWLSASRELANGAAKQELTGMNLAKLADNYKSLEERIVLLVAFGVEQQGMGKR
jgi:hypothetical protein